MAQAIHAVPAEATSRQTKHDHETPNVRLEQGLPAASPVVTNYLVCAGRGVPDHTLYQLPPLGYGDLRPIPQGQTQMGSQPPIFGLPSNPGPYMGGYPSAPMQPIGYRQQGMGIPPGYPPQLPQVAPSANRGMGLGSNDRGFGEVVPAGNTIQKSGGWFPGLGLFSREKQRTVETVSGERPGFSSGPQPTSTGWSWGQ